jgi:HCOMODA/2-hydroxy-3-carboxy-muconic semialdehyde decarboxylase
VTARPSPQQQLLLRQGARALARAGLAHAFGHCSLRLSDDALLVCAPMPMGLIVDELGAVVPIRGPLPSGVLGEVRVHQQIYARRSDVAAVCRIMPPSLMALSTQNVTPRARHGIGAYFAPAPPLWPDPRLLRDDASAAAAAEMLGAAPALVLRGNGAVVVADNLEKAVTLSWFLEDAARVETSVRASGFDPDAGVLSPAEAAARTVFEGGVVERMWRFLTQGDTESSAQE